VWGLRTSHGGSRTSLTSSLHDLSDVKRHAPKIYGHARQPLHGPESISTPAPPGGEGEGRALQWAEERRHLGVVPKTTSYMSQFAKCRRLLRICW